jgi:hypothetical protein
MSDTPAKRAREAKKRRKLEEKRDRKLQRKLNPVADDEMGVGFDMGVESDPGVEGEQVDVEEPIPSPEG